MDRLLASAAALAVAALLVFFIVVAIVSLKLSGAVGFSPPGGDEELGWLNV